MMGLFLLGVTMIAIHKWGKTEYTSTGHKKRIYDCIIEHNGKYWNGVRFSAKKSEAKIFPSDTIAWAYVDNHFSEDTAEDCNLIEIV